jgi:hypothetical protein
MVKGKTCCWLIFVLALGIWASAWASDENTATANRIRWMKDSSCLQKGAKTPLPPYLSHYERTRKSSQAANGTGAISGHVTRAAGGAGIEGVQVSADQLTCPSYSASDYTDASGYYLITGLPAGDYEVSTSNDSVYVDLYWNNKLYWQDPDTVVVTSGNTTEDINFSLRVGGKITGTVTFTGSPMVMSSVIATHTASSHSYYGDATNYMSGSASYYIQGLPTGSYKVKTSNYFGYVNFYYDNKSSQASADPVSVTEGATTPSIDFTLSLGGTIEGNVSSTTKGPLENTTVLGYFASDPEWFTGGMTDEFGDYALPGVRSGWWKICADGDTMYAFEWYNNKNTWNDADSVLVTAPGTTSDKDFSLELGGSISGHVYSTEKGPLSGCDVAAYESSFFGWAMMARWDTTAADGSYRITGLRTGDYYVMAMTECDIIWYDNQSMPQQADLVHVTMPANTPGINFNLPSAVEEEIEVTTSRPTEFELSQNHPNPFNLGTEIKYDLQKRAQVTLEVLNLLGQKVRTLVNEHQPADSFRIVWDGKNDQGEIASSGIYFYRLEVDGVSQTKRMVLLK